MSSESIFIRRSMTFRELLLSNQKAAFYIFPKVDTKKFNIVDDEKFALDLLRDKKILIIHGGGFNWSEPDHFRVVYLPAFIQVLEESIHKMEEFFSYYHQ